MPPADCKENNVPLPKIFLVSTIPVTRIRYSTNEFTNLDVDEESNYINGKLAYDVLYFIPSEDGTPKLY